MSHLSDAGRGAAVGIAAGAVLQLVGYLIVRSGPGANDFGATLFILSPFVAGICMAMYMPDSTGRLQGGGLASLIITILVALTFLVAVGAEGFLCVAMAAPLLFASLLLGFWIGRLLRKRYLRSRVNSTLFKGILLFVGALTVMGSDRAERTYHSSVEYETFVSRVTVPVSPDTAWRLVERMERLDGPLPFLLKHGLPVPRTCVLEGSGVGARRTCYFDQGYIAQQVTGWNFPTAMDLKITGAELPGITWLSYVDASYRFVPTAEGTEIVRRTKIATRLYPRWYWRFFEERGVTAEHDFVLSNIARRAEELRSK